MSNHDQSAEIRKLRAELEHEKTQADGYHRRWQRVEAELEACKVELERSIQLTETMEQSFKATRDQLKSQLEQAQACAESRKRALINLWNKGRDCPGIQGEVESALSSTCGNDLLEELRELRRFASAEYVRDIQAELRRYREKFGPNPEWKTSPEPPQKVW